MPSIAIIEEELTEIRCPNCSRLLLKMRGGADIEILCVKCKKVISIRPGPVEVSLSVLKSGMVV